MLPARALPAVVLLALSTLACDGGGLELVVDLKTDVRPGLEFASVETRVATPDGRVASRGAVPAYSTQDFLAGRRALEARGLAPGTYDVVVELLDRDGGPVARRTARARLDESTVVTILITRDCGGVTCPMAGDAIDETECLAGRCIPSDCVLERPEACPAAACRFDTDCASPVPCASGACSDGVCYVRPDDSLCGTGEWCHPDDGCDRIDPGLLDGGGACPDAAGGCMPCTAGAACSTGNPCEAGTIVCGASGATCSRAGPAAAGTICRAASGDCDRPERCSGSATTCPPDSAAPAGTSCRASAGPCDVAETCDGSAHDCPTDRFAGGSRGCRAGGPCDPAESCDGSGPACPSDSRAPNGTNCGGTWAEHSCGPIDVDYCMGGSCVHRGGYDGADRPSCGTIGAACGFSAQCCGSDGNFCVDEGGNPIYGSSSDCGQCCRVGRCCVDGNPAGPCS